MLGLVRFENKVRLGQLRFGQVEVKLGQVRFGKKKLCLVRFEKSYVGLGQKKKLGWVRLGLKKKLGCVRFEKIVRFSSVR